MAVAETECENIIFTYNKDQSTESNIQAEIIFKQVYWDYNANDLQEHILK